MASRKKTNLVFGLSGGDDGAEARLHEILAKSMVETRVSPSDSGPPSLTKSILNVLNGPGQDIERLAFESDPSQRNNYAGVYRRKLRLIPDEVLKRIAIQDSLVSNIVRARQNHVSPFGRPRPDRFSTGFIIQPNTGVIDDLDDAGRKRLNQRIERAVRMLSNCGHTTGLSTENRATFSEFLNLAARNAVVNGRIAAEVIWTQDGSAEKKFHHFAAVDAGTIFYAIPDNNGAQESVRQSAYDLLCTLTGKKLEKEKFQRNEYCWVQAIEGRPVQVFTADELKTYNFYPVPDVELDGYPVTPIDTVISAITTHINIVTHNRLYFQSGRASRGMLIIKSDDVTPTVVHNIKQQFNASINNVNNSWRMPVFGCGTDENIQWEPIDTGGGKDMEFQYLTDLNAREILTAFMMSPDELPGWSYLSKGTNNQALSESNSEYKLQAARDVGIRPLLHGFEDFANAHLLPLIDEELAKQCRVKLVGLDGDNAEKEAVRLSQDMPLWETYDGVLERVEKKPIGVKWGGNIPLNTTIKAYWDQYFTVGEILAEHCDRPEALKDPRLDYRRDEYYFKHLEMLQAQQAQQQAQQAQQQGGGGAGGDGGGQDPKGGGGGQSPQGGGEGQDDQGGGKGADAMGDFQTDNQKSAAIKESSAKGDELARSIDIAFEAMSKTEAQLPPNKRRALAQQRATVKNFMRGWMEDMDDAVKEIMEVARRHDPKKS
jgi:hypothetical protein